MKKAFDQTVRDLKREVNKKVLKVPSIEQKVLDATSNESWGPHGSLLADIAQATRNYHEYQMIMSIIWKRINDTGKNWRHVYKALIVLDYMVAHGSERAIDDIREHAYQISTLSDFQYIDSGGRDQGSNVRKKSQSLVALVNDKERIQETRQKAAANRGKFQNNYAASAYRSSSEHRDRYDDDHYEGRYRDDERNGNGKYRDWGSKDDDRYGRHSDSYSRDGDRYHRDAEDRYGSESYRDDDYRGRKSVDDYPNGPRGRSADSSKNRIEDDGHNSSRWIGVKADDNPPQDRSSIDKKLDRKYSGRSTDGPPNYEDAVGSAQSPVYVERDGQSSGPPVPKAFGADATHGVASAAPPTLPALETVSFLAPTLESTSSTTNSAAKPGKNEVDIEEFDPRSLLSAAPTPSNGAHTVLPGAQMDLLGSLDAYSASSLALVPAGKLTTPDTERPENLTSEAAVSALQPPAFNSQSFDDPFGDGPFKAAPSVDYVPADQHVPLSSVSLNAASVEGQATPPIPQGSPFEIDGPSILVPSSALVQQEMTSPGLEIDILADILPPASGRAEAQAAHPNASTQSLPQNGFSPEVNQPFSQPGPVMSQNAPENGLQTQNIPSGGFPSQLGQPAMQASHALMPARPITNSGFANQAMGYTYPVQTGVAPQTSQMGFLQAASLQPGLTNADVYGSYHPLPLLTGQYAAYNAPPSSGGPAIRSSFLSQTGSAVSVASQIGQPVPRSQTGNVTSPAPVNASLMGGTAVLSQPFEDKFRTKSSVWADTLSRGLVNLNISGPKANPLADIGVDFDAINRKEKRMEKPSATPVTSTVTMGKAMGAGSGIGRAGAGSLLPPPNPLVGSGMNMGMGVGAFGASQPLGRGMLMNVNPNVPGHLGAGMNMQPVRFPPGAAIPGGGGYSIAMAGYSAQTQAPYGGGYR